MPIVKNSGTEIIHIRPHPPNFSEWLYSVSGGFLVCPKCKESVHIENSKEVVNIYVCACEKWTFGEVPEKKSKKRVYAI